MLNFVNESLHIMPLDLSTKSLGGLIASSFLNIPIMIVQWLLLLDGKCVQTCECDAWCILQHGQHKDLTWCLLVQNLKSSMVWWIKCASPFNQFFSSIFFTHSATKNQWQNIVLSSHPLEISVSIQSFLLFLSRDEHWYHSLPMNYSTAYALVALITACMMIGVWSNFDSANNKW